LGIFKEIPQLELAYWKVLSQVRLRKATDS